MSIRGRGSPPGECEGIVPCLVKSPRERYVLPGIKIDVLDSNTGQK